MDKNTSPNRRLMITKNSILMLVMLVIIFLAIWAWYTNTERVSASMTTLSAGDSDDVELAVPEKNSAGEDVFPISNDSWKNEIKFEKSGYLKDLVKDVTSDGESFIVPNFQASTGLEKGREVNIADVWTNALSSKEALTDALPNNDDQYNYLSLDFYVRSKSSTVNISADSFLAAGSELGVDNTGTIASTPVKRLLKGTSIYRASTYGASEGDANAFSADAIVGAMRVSIVGAPVRTASAGSETLASTPENKFVWLPRPDVYLKADDNQNNWRLYTGVGLSSTYSDKTYFHTFYKGNLVNGTIKKGLTKHIYQDTSVKTYSGEGTAESPTIFHVSKTEGDSDLGTLGHYPTLGKACSLASGAPETSKQINFTAGTAQNDTRATSGYYVYKYTLNIWIEGEDAEARRSMDTGIFSLDLVFGT